MYYNLMIDYGFPNNNFYEDFSILQLILLLFLCWPVSQVSACLFLIVIIVSKHSCTFSFIMMNFYVLFKYKWLI